MLEKIIPSILAALLPFMFTYFNKISKANIRKNLMEDAQKKIDFLDRYFEVSSKLLPDAEIQSLKYQLSNELIAVKNEISALDKKENISDYQRLSGVQKIFLTFIPASVLGWLWAILFYLNLVFVMFAFLGFFLDDQGNFTSDAFSKNIQDYETILGMVIFMIPLLLFRWLAIKNYKSKTNGYKPEQPK